MIRGDPDAFFRHLEKLKEEGSLILAMGNAPAALNRISSQLLSDQSKGRVPMFILLSQDRSVIEDRLGNDVDDTQVLQYGFRRSTADRAHASDTYPAKKLVSSTSIYNDVKTAIEGIEDRRSGPWESGELRVCLDSLIPILDQYERDQIETFLTDFRELVIDRSGMGHCLFPIEPLPSRFEWLPSFFDIVIDARSVEGTPQQRWRLVGADQVTDWFPVDEV